MGRGASGVGDDESMFSAIKILVIRSFNLGDAGL